MVALIGPSGSGKTTLIRTINALESIDAGEIVLYGEDYLKGAAIVDKPQMRAGVRRIGMVFQSFNLFPHRTVLDNVMLAPLYHKLVEPQAAREQALYLLDRVGLLAHAEKYPWQLSGGQRQRAMIAMVFCQQTDYVLLDEPLNNLDMYYAKSLMQLLQRLTHEHKRTTVVVLHDINQAAAYADHIIAMQHGQVAFAGTPDEVFTEANIKTLFNMDAAVIDYAGKKLVVHHV